MLRSQNGIALSIFPLSANPVTTTLRVYQKLVVKVIFKNAKGRKLKLTTPVLTSSEEKEMLSQRLTRRNLLQKS